MDVWQSSEAADARGRAEDGVREAAELDVRPPGELSAFLRNLDLTARALAAGIPREEIGRTTLLDIDLAWHAKELVVYQYARAQAELKLMDYSAESLGEAAEGTGTPEEKKKRAADRERWVKIGIPIKESIRASLDYALMPPYRKAMYVALYGAPPGEKPIFEAGPLTGVSQGVAAAIVEDIKALSFSGTEWGGHPLWEQLDADGDLLYTRLKKTANG